MASYELRITSSLLSQVVQAARAAFGQPVFLRVTRHDGPGDCIELIAQDIAADFMPNVPYDALAVLMADDGVTRAFSDRICHLSALGVAGCLFLDTAGVDGSPIGVVCESGGIDWLCRWVEVGSSGVVSRPLNTAITGISGSRDALARRFKVVGDAPVADGLARSLYSLGISATDAVTRVACVEWELAGTDVVVVCLSDTDDVAAVRSVCDRQLRAMIEVQYEPRTCQAGACIRLEVRLPGGVSTCAATIGMPDLDLSAVMAASIVGQADATLH